MILIPQMDCIVVHPTLAASLQLPEALFLKCTCIPPPPPNAHAYPNFLHRWRQKNGIPSRAKHNVSTNCGWRRRVKAGIANSLSVRCARACQFARTHVRMREQRVTWWAKKRASFQKKQGGSREKKGRFARNSTSFYSASPHSRKTKHFSHKTFDYSKLNPYFYAW